jgi:hypothetical protein
MTSFHADLRRLAVISLACALTTGAARAQTRAPVSFPSASGQSVRIRLSSGAYAPGSLTALDTHDGRLVLGAPVRSLALAQIDSLWIRRDRVRAGAVVGGVAAGSAMFAFTSSVCFTGIGCLASGPGDTVGARWRVVGLSTVVATVAGALTGAAIGRFVRRWAPVELP